MPALTSDSTAVVYHGSLTELHGPAVLLGYYGTSMAVLECVDPATDEPTRIVCRVASFTFQRPNYAATRDDLS